MDRVYVVDPPELAVETVPLDYFHQAFAAEEGLAVGALLSRQPDCVFAHPANVILFDHFSHGVRLSHTIRFEHLCSVVKTQ